MNYSTFNITHWALCLLVLASCGEVKRNEGDGTATVKVATVQGADEDMVWQLPGRVKASGETNVAFKVSGTLRRVAVKEGQRVAAGQLLAEMDDTDYRIQLQATEAEAAGIRAEAERVMALYEQQGTTASNYDKARFGLQQIEAKLEHHRNQLAYCRIYAPTAGRVQTLYFEGGETVGQGMPVARIVDSGLQEMEVALPTQVYTHVEGITEATATFSAYPGRTFSLKPLHTLPKANATGLYILRLAMEGSDLPSPGMGGWVTLKAGNPTPALPTGGGGDPVTCSSDKANDKASSLVGEGRGGVSFLIPTTAVLHEGGHDMVFVVRDGKAHRTEVSVLSLKGDGDAVVTGNLSAGDEVVASGVHHINDGQAVQPLAPATKTNVGGLL